MNKKLTPHLRYQVYADYDNGDRGVLVNGYSSKDLADRVASFIVKCPGSFVTGSWVVDSGA